MIEKCSFGKMTIEGRLYTSDLKIFPDGTVLDAWRRARGHRLLWEEIDDLVAARPEILVIGTGIFGRMKASGDLGQRLAQANIQMMTLWNKKAVDVFNTSRLQKKVAACFHLTC